VPTEKNETIARILTATRSSANVNPRECSFQYFPLQRKIGKYVMQKPENQFLFGIYACF
jgi:hypothetical protein